MEILAPGRGSVLIEALAQRLRRRRLGEYKAMEGFSGLPGFGDFT